MADGPTEQSINWVASFQDNVTGPLEGLMQTAANVWSQVSGVFQQGARGVSEAEQQVVQSLEEAQVTLDLFVRQALEAGTGIQDSLSQSLLDLFSLLEGAETGDIAQLADDFLAASGGADALAGTLSQLGEESAEQLRRAIVTLQQGLGAEMPDALRNALEQGAASIGLEIPGLSVGVAGGELESGLDTTNALLNLISGVLLNGFERMYETGRIALGYMHNLLTRGDLLEMFQGIVKFMTGVPDAVRQVVLGAVEGLEVAIDKVGTRVEGVRGEGGTPGTTGTGAGEAGPAGDAFKVPKEVGLFSKVFSTISTAAGAAFTSLKPMVLIAGSIATLIRPIVSMASELFEALLEPFVGLSEILSTALVPLFDALAAVMYPLADALAPVIETVTDLVSGLFSMLIPGFEVFGAILRLVSVPLRLILIPFKVFGRMMETFGDLVSDMLNVVLEPMMLVLDAVEDAIYELMDTLEEMGIDVIEDLLAPAMRNAAGAAVMLAEAVVWLMNTMSSALKWLSLGKIDLGKFAMPGVEEGLEPEIGEPIRVAPVEFEEIEHGPGVIFEDKDPVASATQRKEDFREILDEHADRILAGMEVQTRDEVKAIAKTELDPDDWIEVDPAVAKVASFGVA